MLLQYTPKKYQTHTLHSAKAADAEGALGSPAHLPRALVAASGGRAGQVLFWFACFGCFIRSKLIKSNDQGQIQPTTSYFLVLKKSVPCTLVSSFQSEASAAVDDFLSIFLESFSFFSLLIYYLFSLLNHSTLVPSYPLHKFSQTHPHACICTR